MQSISLALYWHQHQPYYPDDVSGETLMPWVRLHGTKDYYGMALLLQEVPEFHCTINLAPSLLVQIQRYVEQQGSDRHLDVSRIPADGLSETDAAYLLDHFFMASVDGMIRPHPRYYELYLKRRGGQETAAQALTRFSTSDLRDLQVWNNLIWMHPLAFARDPELQELRSKGRHWTESEKQLLLDKQRQILARIIPLHRELAARGQVELTTTPFYHPILPLLWDKRVARQAMPECELPKFLDYYPQDARWHVDRAMAFHRELFGEPPVGMWPSEGAVSQDIIALMAQAGVEWFATDEEILARSTSGWISRDAQGHLRHPEMLYRPWHVEEHGHPLQIIFRDHGLSDLIGFHYQRSDPVRAAHDLLSRVESIGRMVEPNNQGRPALVPIILDGENCWEYYPDGGIEFLRTLYRGAAEHPYIRPTRIRDHLRDYPATDRIGKLFAGSWIAHNFAIWIGHQEDNTAWDLLHSTRQFLTHTQALNQLPKSVLTAAWNEIYIVEGSDWFWWFGDDHSSAQDALFDQLFRKHLQNVYVLCGSQPPAVLSRPIARLQRRTHYSDPKAFLQVKVDGRRSYFEWINAGHYVSGNERGTMNLVSEGVLREVYFGFDVERLMIRFDTPRHARDDLRGLDEVRLTFLEPVGYELRITDPGRPEMSARLQFQGELIDPADLQLAIEHICEVTVPFQALDVQADEPVQFFVEVFGNGQSVDRAPREGVIELRVPGPDYERIMWQA